MSQGIVLQLQEDCLKPDFPISALLRKAKVIASKLNVGEFEEWIDSELGGYKGRMIDLPAHRVGLGQPKFFNPYHGWLDVIVGEGNLSEIVSTARLPQPVAELEQLATKGSGSHVILGYRASIVDFLNKMNNMDFNYGLHLSKSFIHGALEHARNTTLEWTLQLEKKGVIGENFSFSSTEKEAAKTVTNNIYNSNVGVLGGVSGNASNTKFSTKSGNVDPTASLELSRQIREAIGGLPPGLAAALSAPNNDLESASKNRDPARIKSAIEAVKKVLEGASGNLVASGILAGISAL